MSPLQLQVSLLHKLLPHSSYVPLNSYRLHATSVPLCTADRLLVQAAASDT